MPPGPPSAGGTPRASCGNRYFLQAGISSTSYVRRTEARGAVLCGCNSNERRRGEGSEDWKTEVQGGLRDETGFQTGSFASTLLPTGPDLGEVPEAPVAGSESLGVFAASFIVYRTQAKPLKLNRGSAGLYIQTPINMAVSPAAGDSPCSSLLKLAEVQLGMLASGGRGWESRAGSYLRA